MSEENNNMVVSVQNETHLPRKEFLSGSALKLIAVITMLIDHIGCFLISEIPSANETFLHLPFIDLSWYLVMRLIGRIAFPIYGFLLTEGLEHTHNKKKYTLNLLLFAFISAIPWNLLHSGKLYYHQQNIFFTLFLGLLSMMVYEKYKDSFEKKAILLVLLFGLPILFPIDYGTEGVIFLYLLYRLKKKPILQATLPCFLIGYPFACMLAFIPINLYNHQRGFIHGKFFKYAFYAFYPAHMLILYFIKASVFGYPD